MHRPKAVCFVDSSGLNLRIAKGLFQQGFSAKAGGKTKALYYISPQIWASRAGRRFEMAKHLDGLAAIFPFEPAVYADTTLPVEFVGHPFVAPDYVAPVKFDANGPVLLLPGSRRQVVNRLFPALIGAYDVAGISRPAVALYPSEEIRTCLQMWKDRATAGSKIELYPVGGQPVAASAVLTASGTMSMHCALAGIPGALTYKTDALTYLLGRLLVKVEYIGIANLLLKAPMYPEFIQGAATATALAAQLRECLDSPQRLAQTKAYATQLHALLRAPSQSTAADWVGGHFGL
jgi:lipid-A-disaccharide synthase